MLGGVHPQVNLALGCGNLFAAHDGLASRFHPCLHKLFHPLQDLIFVFTNSSTLGRTSSSDMLVESSIRASGAGTKGEAARVRSRRSRSRSSAAVNSAEASPPFCCRKRRCSRTTGSASRKILTSALGKTLVPISRPSI